MEELIFLFIESEEIDPYFFWISNTTLAEGMIVDYICNKAPFITENWSIPEKELLLNQTQLSLDLIMIPPKSHLKSIIIQLYMLIHVLQFLKMGLKFLLYYVFIQ